MLNLKNGNLSVEDIITDGEYKSDVLDYVVAEVESSDKLKLQLFNQWIEDKVLDKDFETVNYFKGMKTKELLMYMDVYDIVQYYAETRIEDFVSELDIDWTGLLESFGIR